MSIISVILLADELQSLRQLASVVDNQPISRTHRESLIRAGFAAFQTGALTVTTRGRAKLAFEITRASWCPIPL